MLIKLFENVNVQVKFTPEKTTKAQKGNRGIALLFFNLHARWGGWTTPRPGRFTPQKDLIPIAKEAGWVPGRVWTGAENLAPTGIRSSDRPAHREPLNRLSYPGLQSFSKTEVIYRGSQF